MRAARSRPLIAPDEECRTQRTAGGCSPGAPIRILELGGVYVARGAVNMTGLAGAASGRRAITRPSFLPRSRTKADEPAPAPAAAKVFSWGRRTGRKSKDSQAAENGAAEDLLPEALGPDSLAPASVEEEDDLGTQPPPLRPRSREGHRSKELPEGRGSKEGSSSNEQLPPNIPSDDDASSFAAQDSPSIWTAWPAAEDDAASALVVPLPSSDARVDGARDHEEEVASNAPDPALIEAKMSRVRATKASPFGLAAAASASVEETTSGDLGVVSTQMAWLEQAEANDDVAPTPTRARTPSPSRPHSPPEGVPPAAPTAAPTCQSSPNASASPKSAEVAELTAEVYELGIDTAEGANAASEYRRRAEALQEELASAQAQQEALQHQLRERQLELSAAKAGQRRSEAHADALTSTAEAAAQAAARAAIKAATEANRLEMERFRNDVLTAVGDAQAAWIATWQQQQAAAEMRTKASLEVLFEERMRRALLDTMQECALPMPPGRSGQLAMALLAPPKKSEGKAAPFMIQIPKGSRSTSPQLPPGSPRITPSDEGDIPSPAFSLVASSSSSSTANATTAAEAANAITAAEAVFATAAAEAVSGPSAAIPSTDFLVGTIPMVSSDLVSTSSPSKSYTKPLAQPPQHLAEPTSDTLAPVAALANSVASSPASNVDSSNIMTVSERRRSFEPVAVHEDDWLLSPPGPPPQPPPRRSKSGQNLSAIPSPISVRSAPVTPPKSPNRLPTAGPASIKSSSFSLPPASASPSFDPSSPPKWLRGALAGAYRSLQSAFAGTGSGGSDIASPEPPTAAPVPAPPEPPPLPPSLLSSKTAPVQAQPQHLAVLEEIRLRNGSTGLRSRSVSASAAAPGASGIAADLAAAMAKRRSSIDAYSKDDSSDDDAEAEAAWTIEEVNNVRGCNEVPMNPLADGADSNLPMAHSLQHRARSATEPSASALTTSLLDSLPTRVPPPGRPRSRSKNGGSPKHKLSQLAEGAGSSPKSSGLSPHESPAGAATAMPDAGSLSPPAPGSLGHALSRISCTPDRRVTTPNGGIRRTPSAEARLDVMSRRLREAEAQASGRRRMRHAMMRRVLGGALVIVAAMLFAIVDTRSDPPADVGSSGQSFAVFRSTFSPSPPGGLARKEKVARQSAFRLWGAAVV